MFGLGFPGATFGFVLGGTVGAIVGKPTGTENEPEPLIDALRNAVPKGGSAVALLAWPEHVDAMIAALESSGGEIVRRSLTEEQAAELEALLAAAPRASDGPTEQGPSATP